MVIPRTYRPGQQASMQQMHTFSVWIKKVPHQLWTKKWILWTKYWNRKCWKQAPVYKRVNKSHLIHLPRNSPLSLHLQLQAASASTFNLKLSIFYLFFFSWGETRKENSVLPMKLFVQKWFCFKILGECYLM